MAWCPECKCEYVEGVTKCADCGCDLVDSLQETTEEEHYEMPEETLEEEASGEESEKKKPEKHTIYVNNEEKAEENRTSAFTLLIIGGLGFVFVLLFFFDVIHIPMAVFSKYLIGGVMGVMFVLFLIMGFISLRNFEILKKRAVKENSLTDEIKKWCLRNLNGEQIDAELDFADTEEELKYFQRFEYVKSAVQKQFVNLDEAYLERLVEEMYSDLFEKEDE